MVPAVDYIRIQRVRRMLMSAMEDLMRTVDVLVNVPELLHTNLTGHPSVIMPIGFRSRQGVDSPYSVILTGRLNEDDRLLAIAAAYQQRISAHLRRPPLERWLADPPKMDE